jgi:hypothetical protein
VSKPSFQADLPGTLKKELGAKISKESRSVKKKLKKSQAEEMQYHPGRVSPLDYLVFKILHGQFGENSHPAFPIAIGVFRKGLSQIKRLISHGSL